MSHHLKADHIDDAMHECIDTCSDCHDVCVETLVHCLSLGGEHAAPEHLKALLDCAQACDASRDFMLRGSDLHHAYCGACAPRPASAAPSRANASPATTRSCATALRPAGAAPTAAAPWPRRAQQHRAPDARRAASAARSTPRQAECAIQPRRLGRVGNG